MAKDRKKNKIKPLPPPVQLPQEFVYKGLTVTNVGGCTKTNRFLLKPLKGRQFVVRWEDIKEFMK